MIFLKLNHNHLASCSVCARSGFTAQNTKFSIKDFFSKFPQFPADLVTFTEEIINENFIFCAAFEPQQMFKKCLCCKSCSQNNYSFYK